ncbi:hypothetical protein IWW55_001513 [Coemansia sp. RSA 2706]|nr:hypothetical protein IWW55_001513 [Coemansia sp. RSA 2706]KAJ2318723.1 hypothetical protein IWW52_002390 [Coemansia sp. RSA 2704]KAJ2328096.1 hypothetical protein IWW51_001386 [Coemansia sp. RSA 2702]KAJ2391437.1 hypothetical protein H4S02_001334 [Coemansia sp. RSA 2611]KAJ2738416.1 hypothetical protein H4R23_001166 [Coemansia sp. Cherry 401B]
MAKTGVLPFDVVVRVLYYATDSFYQTPAEWKTHLAYLAVNRDWRAASWRYLYQCAFITFTEAPRPRSPLRVLNRCKMDKGFWNRNPKVMPIALTNIGLIEQLGHQSVVKVLAFNDKIQHLDGSFIYDMADALSIVTKCGMYAFSDFWIDPRGTPIDPAAMEHAGLYGEGQELAAIIAGILPNVECLYIRSHVAYPYVTIFYEQLAKSYMEQLRVYYNYTKGFGPNLGAATRLSRFEMYYTPWRLSRQDVTIYPCSLRDLTLYLDCDFFVWSLFQCDTESDIAFNELRNLTLIGNEKFNLEVDVDTSISYEGVHDPFAVTLPMLQKLVIEDTPVNSIDAERLVQPTLENLTYAGSIFSALRLCRQPISMLKQLHLSFGVRLMVHLDTAFLEQTNEIVSAAQGIPAVHLYLRSESAFPRYTRIDWPHLTSLELSVRIDLAELLATIHTMPRLVTLLINLDCFEKQAMADAVVKLDNLKRSHPGPSLSRLRFIELRCPIIKPTQEFSRVTDGLAWYFPELERFVIKQVNHDPQASLVAKRIIDIVS